MDRQCLLALFQQELNEAEKRLQDTSDYLDLAIQLNRSPFPTPSTLQRVKLAARAYRRAVDDRAMALSRLQSLAASDPMQEELKRHGPGKAHSSSAKSVRQSA
jgi:hypothetical protein